MVFQSIRDPAQKSLLLLTATLFVSYLCVAIALPIVSIFVTRELGLSNAWAGLAVGVAFFSTIFSRRLAGGLTDRRGAKLAVGRGLICYAVASLICMAAALLDGMPLVSYAVLIVGRLLLGLGESLAAVGILTWAIGVVGAARSSRALAWIGAAIYGALAVGGPIGVVLYDRIGFAGAMAISAVLPCLSLLAVWRIAGIAVHADAVRASFWTVIGKIWRHGAVVGLQGVGFAAIGAFLALHFLHENWSHAGLGLTAFGGGFVMVRLLFGHLPDRFGGLPVAIGSLAIELVGQVLIWSADAPALALAGAFLTGLGCSMVFPAMGREVVRLIEPQLRGTALGGFAAFQDLAYGLAGPVAGLLADRAGYGSVFLIGAVSAAIGLVVALKLYRAQPPSSV